MIDTSKEAISSSDKYLTELKIAEYFLNRVINFSHCSLHSNNNLLSPKSKDSTIYGIELHNISMFSSLGRCDSHYQHRSYYGILVIAHQSSLELHPMTMYKDQLLSSFPDPPPFQK